MAYSTLDAIRTGGLNHELGLTSDSDNTWGDTTRRNFFIQRAFAKLWPEMARSRRYTLTVVEGQQEYNLTTLSIPLREIISITVFDSAGSEVDAVRSWNLYMDEAAEPRTSRLIVPDGLSGQDTVYLYGYQPYIVPSTGAASCDLPPELEYVVTAGARVEAYRSKLNEYANFPRLANENRSNALSAAEVLELMRSATSDFREARAANAKEAAAPKRAIRTTR